MPVALRQLVPGARFIAPGLAKRGTLLAIGSWGAKVEYVDISGASKQAEWAAGTEVMTQGKAFTEAWKDAPAEALSEPANGTSEDSPPPASLPGNQATEEPAPSKTKSRYDLFGFPVTSVLRALGKDGWNVEQASKALAALNIPCAPATIAIQIKAGAKGERGDPASLTAEHWKQLNAILAPAPSTKPKPKTQKGKK